MLGGHGAGQTRPDIRQTTVGVAHSDHVANVGLWNTTDVLPPPKGEGAAGRKKRENRLPNDAPHCFFFPFSPSFGFPTSHACHEAQPTLQALGDDAPDIANDCEGEEEKGGGGGSLACWLASKRIRGEHTAPSMQRRRASFHHPRFLYLSLSRLRARSPFRAKKEKLHSAFRRRTAENAHPPSRNAADTATRDKNR